ncbi:inosine-uridine nucleoside N-ribohydrolase [Lactobacillus colini]|uniref:Inosine-uridine nucleoside N-ribohydrolase n=1 Tax=Lactobacillus colini TaxID=1819254 RepID=A0ABS4MEU5_9LACO|nr:nucleoside hydrolase [Lactobacillus colini]MBP2058206.1 inosine-uridine nucleoside N-ribohydrolase [Lactobacillus colini]
MNKSIPVILSTDPGIDDAVALSICMFNKDIDLKLISAAAGNVGINQTLENILRLESFFKKSIPVVKGVDRAIIKSSINATHVHGKTGMDGYNFPNPNYSLLINKIAPDAIHNIVSNSLDKITLIGIGPLTDYALYLRLYPEDKENIEKIVIMGGAIGRGNYGIYSEFNIASDPEAARIVFESGLKIEVAPMELGLQAKIMPNVSEEIKTYGKAGDMFYSLFKKYRGGSFSTGLKIYDALAIGILLKPDMFRFEHVHVEINTQEGYTYGASLFDLKNKLKKLENAYVATSVDFNEFVEWFKKSIKDCD